MALSKLGVLRAGLEFVTLLIKVFHWAEGAPFFWEKQCQLPSEVETCILNVLIGRREHHSFGKSRRQLPSEFSPLKLG